jgi:hypothetical protein
MMNRLKIDVTGAKFGRLTVVKKTTNTRGRKAWLCVCECGGTKVVEYSQLKNGETRSCGCLFIAMSIDKIGAYKTHGLSNSKVYRTWASMIARCKYPSASGYKNYGGRGISVCSNWQKFENFLSDMGEPRDGESLERINNDGNYEPTNCKWIPLREQRLNTRRSKRNKLLAFTAMSKENK